MKTLKNLVKFSILSISLFLASCSGDDAAAEVVSNNIPGSGSYIMAKVDGADFNSVIFGVTTASATRMETMTGTMITILGANQNADSIVINLMGITATGTYTIDPSVDSVLAFTPVTGGVSYSTGECSGTTGTLVVTAIDNAKIEGTFSFKGKDSDTCPSSAMKTVTEGSFRGVF